MEVLCAVFVQGANDFNRHVLKVCCHICWAEQTKSDALSLRCPRPSSLALASPLLCFPPASFSISFSLPLISRSHLSTPLPPSIPHPSLSSPCFLLPLSSPVQWRFNDAVIHSCGGLCLLVMWPKPAWQHGEQHSLGCFVYVRAHKCTLTPRAARQTLTHAQTPPSSFSQS